MASYRVSAGRILPEPVLEFRDGTVIADYAAFDEAAAFALEELGFLRLYMPDVFYLFGWAMPPQEKFGEAPYPGGYPYAGADRSQLRRSYKRAYQAVLADFWAHLGSRGWEDRFVLYIADEPNYWEPEIAAQMTALVAMIHEVDPAIPVYSSSWEQVPAWDGQLDVWGLSHFGLVPPETLAAMRAGGARLWFTTDGQMAIDTPYCGVERLLPWYAFRHDVEAYEFWAMDWLTYDPWRFGWHAPVPDEIRPDEIHMGRFPNGDGYLIYPGAPVGHDGPVPTLRLEQVREGLEDHAYLEMLRTRLEAARGCEVAQAETALADALALAVIPNAGGLRSTEILPDPGALYRAREAMAEAIELLGSEACRDDAVLLNGDRFRVEITWRDFADRSGPGYAVPYRSDDSALFWFFDPDNWEVLLKVLDACGVNDHFWVFAAATTNVEYEITVIDTRTGSVRRYSNPLGRSSPAIIDTSAFACP